MSAKHRRSNNPSLASVGAAGRRADLRDFGLNADGYVPAAYINWAGTLAGTAGPMDGYPAPDYYDDARAEQGWSPGAGGYRASNDYGYDYPPADQDWAAGAGGYRASNDYGYDYRPADEDWASAAGLDSQGRPGGGAPLSLHPDHPSAPVPRVQLPADHPSGPMWSPRAAPPGHSSSRGPSAPSPRRPGRTRNSGRHESVTLGYLTVHRERDDYQREYDQERRQPSAYQQQAGQGVLDATDYRREADPYGPGPGSEAGWFRDERSTDGNQPWAAQEAEEEASAIREAAAREAAAIREAAEREAEELRDRLDSMRAELGQLMAGFGTDTLTRRALPAPAPTRPRAEPKPGMTGAASAMPDTMPAGPDTTPGTRPARSTTTPAGPRTAPTRTPAKPAVKPVTKQQQQGRQKRAMRIATYGTAAALVLSLGFAGLELQHNGYGFFVFRENGQGDSPSSGPGRVGVDQLDNQFLAAQAAARAKAAHHAPGRHAKTSPSSTGSTATSTTRG